MLSFLYSRDSTNHAKVTLEEFESHCTSDSLWVSIGTKVYDITAYIPNHPGGTKCLLANAATDISYHVGFHSKRMKELIKPMLIGELDASSVKILRVKKEQNQRQMQDDCCTPFCC